MNKLVPALKKMMLHSRLDIIQRIYLLVKYQGWSKIYSKIGGGNKRLYVCPYKGTGDVYMACSLLSTYLGNNKTSTIVTVGNSAKNVAKLFSFDDVRAITQKEMSKLMELITFLGPDALNVFMMHPDPPKSRYGIMDRMRNYNELNFKDMFAAGVFGNVTLKCADPTFENCYDEAKQFFSDNGLIKGRTVIIAPNVNTLLRLPEWVWITIVSELKNCGFTVCTNCSGNELPVFGSVKMDVPYSKIKDYVEYAGFVISSRSGFCEVISQCKSKMIVIYQSDVFWGPAGNIDYFSLKTMGINKKAIEIQYHGVEFLDLIDEVVWQVCN